MRTTKRTWGLCAALLVCASAHAEAPVTANSQYFTVAIGLWNMLQKEYIHDWYTCFAAGAVCVSIPIAILFVYMQQFYVEGMSGAVKG